jgi:hypothetical protein
MKKYYLLLIALILYIIQIETQADIIGRYQGLNQMVVKADIIALVKIETKAVYDSDNKQWLRWDIVESKLKKGEIAYDPRWGTQSGIYIPYFLTPIQFIKGSFGNLTAEPIELGMLDFNDITTSASFHADTIDQYIMQHIGSIQPGNSALVFLQDTKRANPNRYQSLNYPGSVIIISQKTAMMKYKEDEPEARVKSIILQEMKQPAVKL